MAKDVLWSERASGEYEKLLEYLLEEWGDTITRRVRQEINQTILHISKSPEHFPVYLKSKKIRRCVASPQTSIFFRANKESVEIISLFDNRQSPKKRRL